MSNFLPGPMASESSESSFTFLDLWPMGFWGVSHIPETPCLTQAITIVHTETCPCSHWWAGKAIRSQICTGLDVGSGIRVEVLNTIRRFHTQLFVSATQTRSGFSPQAAGPVFFLSGVETSQGISFYTKSSLQLSSMALTRSPWEGHTWSPEVKWFISCLNPMFK